MEDITKKIQYIYFNIDGLYYFLSTKGISDYSKRCVMRRFFILVDSFFEMIGFLKNDLSKKNIINLKIKNNLEHSIESIKKEWDNKYEIIRNKFSAHHQKIDDLILLEWWNEIDFSTITFFYEGMCEIRSILLNHAGILTSMPTDYTNIDFSDTCLKEDEDHIFKVAHDRLALSKKNTVGMISSNEFQQKCMLILSIIDFIFINCAITLKTQNYSTNYKKILFDSAWLLVCCDTFSLIESMYENGMNGNSLLSLSPSDWKGETIIKDGNLQRDKAFEENMIILRNKFAAHIDVKDKYSNLIILFEKFDLKRLHEYSIFNMQLFQKACLSDRRTKMFAYRDMKLSNDVLGLSYTGYKTINK